MQKKTGNKFLDIKDIRIGIVGATGAVGEVALEILESNSHPIENIIAIASPRSEGKKINYSNKYLIVKSFHENMLDFLDVLIISATSAVSRELSTIAKAKGILVIDDGSTFRMDDKVPLVVPEVNAYDIDWHKGIISTPNCTTTPLVMVIDSLRTLGTVIRVNVSTYQAVTGTGSLAKRELINQTKAMIDDNHYEVEVYPHPIGFNLLPHVDEFFSNGYTKEEMKMVNESKKILHDDSINISATCVRVPVRVSHSESVQIEFSNDVKIHEVLKNLNAYKGIEVFDKVDSNHYPTPLNSSGQDSVFVGRVRKDISLSNGISLWLSCDNLRKGASLNALQILNEVKKRDPERFNR
ncbi:MAG: aspartate-semialdehyde dehydrogenase [Chloroflexi bacterium]|nr:aspartate-semialdehyde dehydrogenase [Chloroflexota bacterium]|tara:strand:- start:2879 stop:3937 length:1059 start_codon:yes stop_codon:yes gene_type:complete